MILLYLKLAMLYLPSIQSQVEGNNCLRDNAGVLDADFSILNRFENHYDFDEEDISKHVTLFRTRFKRGHSVSKFNKKRTQLIGDGVSLYNQGNPDKFQFFLNVFVRKETDNITEGIQLYKEDYEAVRNINSGNAGPVTGLYVGHRMDTYKNELKALEAVFGPKENSTFPIGVIYTTCLERLTVKGGIKLMQRMDFLTCVFLVTPMSSPEESADEFIQICQKFQNAAASLNITAVIMCRTGYPTLGTTRKGVVGSVMDFRRFWCRVVKRITMSKSIPQIIMQSSFDDTPNEYKRNGTKLDDPDRHCGWWRRRETTSYEATAFAEKVEELEGVREPRNCTEICSPCDSNVECCEKTYCEPDDSFQPFEEGPSHRVCKTVLLTCAPRPPKISSSMINIHKGNPTASHPKHVTIHSSPTPSTTMPPTIILADGSSVLSSTAESGNSIVNTVVVSVFALIALLLVMSGIAFFLRKARSNAVLTQQELNQFFDGTTFPDRPKNGPEDAEKMVRNLPYDKRLEISKHDFEIREDQYLGFGAFGFVMKGLLGKDDVAVKTTLPGVDKLYFKSLLLELKVLMYLGQHENIVNLLGAHTSQVNSGKLYIFLELCSMGNLLEFLRINRDNFSHNASIQHKQGENQDFQLTCKHLLQWSVQIARAMEHLANKRVIHADIAARNVLVFSTDNVKLTDFGLSRRLYQYAHYVKKGQEPLPWRHMSVEALRDMKFSVQSDIWSFGVTMWEMFSLGSVPYPGHSLSEDFVELLLGGLSLPCPKHAHPRVYLVMKSCWKLDVQSRPSIALVNSQLVCALDEIYTKSLYICPMNIS